MQVREAIAARKSIRSYLDKPVEPWKLGVVLDAGRMAPTAANRQEQRIIVVKDKAIRDELMAACRDQKSVKEAPVVLVVCTNDQREMPCEQPAHVVDASIALSFMMLQATELGLSTCWLGAFFQDKIRAVLNIPDDFAVVAVAPLGYAAEPGRDRDRLGIDTFVIDEKC